MINDISTDVINPPEYVELAKLNAKRDYSFPQAGLREHKEKYLSLGPLATELAIDKAFAAVKALAKKQSNWQLVSVSDAEYRVEAVATTYWLRFKDDIVIEVRATIAGSEVHMRSKSRMGRDDFGANAKRINEFFTQLKSQL